MSPDLLPCIENTSDNWDNWRLAESLRVMLKIINTLAPARKKHADGAIGDGLHQSKNSDHNPWVWDYKTKKGIVTALDITHDPAGRCDCANLATSLVNSKDARIKYIIWNKKIIHASTVHGGEAWAWSPYTGANPHDKHIHISVKCQKEYYDDDALWHIGPSQI